MLKVDGHGYSPTIVHRVLHMASVTNSFDVAATALKVVGEVEISDRQINKLATEAGEQMGVERDLRTQAYLNQPLPRQPTQVEVPVDLAAVFCDGGRMRTREPDQGQGVHAPHWRETKNAAFHRMKSGGFEVDPQPELPECFRNQAYVEKLVGGLKSLKNTGREEDEPDASPRPAAEEVAEPSTAVQPEWQPETIFRTCLSSLVASDEFGPMMAAEADRRGFYTARKKAFLADGLPYNWTIQQRWFRDFQPVADFVHVVEYVYTAAKTMQEAIPARWQQYLRWATACWQGRVAEVLEELGQWQSRVGLMPKGEKLPDSDPRQVAHATISYFTNNRSRMDYPRYRRQGLPVTSSLAESVVKQISQRVKGTEKFWNDGPSGEAILQLRAAVLSDGDRLRMWIRDRPTSPFSPRSRSLVLKSSA